MENPRIDQSRRDSDFSFIMPAKQARILNYIENWLGNYSLNPKEYPKRGFDKILEETLAAFLAPREGSKRTLIRWYSYFLKFGKLKSIDRKRNSRHNNGRRAVVPFWGEDEQLNAMKRIVDNYPELYLDEIQDHFLAATGKWASPTSIWRCLHRQLGYSLQVATYRAKLWSDEEPPQYLDSVRTHVTYPSMALFLDEMHKDYKESRRRRYWSIWKRQPIIEEDFTGKEDKIAYSTIVAADINGFLFPLCDIIQSKSRPCYSN